METENLQNGNKTNETTKPAVPSTPPATMVPAGDGNTQREARDPAAGRLDGEGRRDGGRNRNRQDRNGRSGRRPSSEATDGLKGQPSREPDTRVEGKNRMEQPERSRDNQRDGGRDKNRNPRTASGREAQAPRDRGPGARNPEHGALPDATEKTAQGGREQARQGRDFTDRPRSPERRMLDPTRLAKKREETLEDIQADIERVEKDIQFEIKQIQTVILGL